jgi:hypothetical protein
MNHSLKLVGLGVAAGFCALVLTPTENDAKVSHSEGGGSEALPPGGLGLSAQSCGSNLASEWVPHTGFDSNVALQYLERSDDSPGDGVLLNVVERASATADWDERSFLYGTTYDVLEIGALDEGDYLLAGRARNGDVVIERWVVQPARGGWLGRGAVFADSQVFSGSAAPAPGSSAPFLNGQTFIPPTQRPNPPVIDRYELYRGNLTALPIEAIAGDGLGETALLLLSDASAGLGELWEVNLDGSGAQIAYTQASAPGLVTSNFIDVHYSDAGVWAFTCLAYGGLVNYSGLHGQEPQHYVFERNSAGAPLVGPVVFPTELSWRQVYGSWHWPNGRQ